MSTHGTTGHWSTEIKRTARVRGLIGPMREAFGGRVPEDRTIFSLGGQQVSGDGELIPGTELSELLSSGMLVAGSQYYSVEWQRAIHESNSRYVGEDALDERALPGWDKPNWLRGNFFVQLRSHLRQGKQPAMIYADLMGFYNTVRTEMISLFRTPLPKGTLISINCICQCQWHDNMGLDDYIRDVTSAIRADLPRGKWIVKDHFKYHGSKMTWMETVVLQKR